MRKYSNCRETDKLEGVIIDSGNGNIKEEAEVDNLINGEETGPPNTETETDENAVNKEEVETIDGEETEAPDIVDNLINSEETGPPTNTETETDEDAVNKEEDESIKGEKVDENAQNDDDPLVAVVGPLVAVVESEQEVPNYNINNESEKEDNEGRKKRKRN